MKKLSILLGFGLILTTILSACEGLPFDLPWLTDEIPTATQPAGEEIVLTPTPELTLDVEGTTPPITSLTVWVPPEMDPSLETEASLLFADRLQNFSEAKGGLEIIVRVKAASGAGGLLDALTATNAAAPDALPDLIALSRPDLETAALKGLISPLDGLTEIPDDTDWFSFTRQMALLQGSTFGFPFGADSLVLVYRPSEISDFPTGWAPLIEESLVLAFPAESDQSLFLMSLYQAQGGLLQDNQRRPLLEIEPLTDVFRLFQDGVDSGTFPEWLSQYQTASQVWTAFREGQVDLAVIWFSDYLKEKPADTAVAPLYSVSNGAVSLGTGISWALASPEAHRHPLAVELAEFLVESDYLAGWTAAAGYMPPRPSSVESWQDQSLRTTISQVALMTRLRPTNDVIVSIGPILREATRQMLQDVVDPVQAAQVALESLGD